MSKKQILTLVLALTALTAQVAFAAELPANVQNIRADLSNGTLTVTWNAVPNATFYRVYYSHESILQNQGNYDDFERTIAAETTHSFAKLPLTSPQIFLSVLAVDAHGNESEGFEQEASVDQPKTAVPLPAEPVVTDAPPPESSSQTSDAMPQGENPTTTAVPMNLSSVTSVSSTGVTVTFTKNIRTGAAINPAFFVLTDSGGVALRVNSVLINGDTVLLATDRQVPEREYLLALALPIPAEDGTNAVPASTPISFRGFGVFVPSEPEPPKSPESQVSTPAEPDIPYGQNPFIGGGQPLPPPQGGYGQNPFVAAIGDPSGLDIEANPRDDGTYDVIARWNGASNAENYALYTSVNGQPYAWNSQVGPSQTSVQYNRVRPGTFAIKVAARTASGQESRGIERAINLPASGIGLIGLLVVAGATAGASVHRRRKSV